MAQLLNIITVTKDDLEGVTNSIQTTRRLRMMDGVRQIIVDSSGEGVRKKIKEIACIETHVDYVWQPPSGIAPAFNLGLSMSNAEWIWFLNGGDEVHQDVDPQNLLYLLKKSKADAIIFEIERKQSRIRSNHPPLWALWPPVFYWIPHPATIVRCRLFETYGTFNEKYKIAMDGEMWFRFFSKDAVVDMLSLSIALYDERGISSTQRRYTAKEGVQIIRSNLWVLLKMWLINGIKIFAALISLHKESKSG